MKKISREKLLEIAVQIRLLILDVDGVLTDGSITLDNNDNEFKSFHVRDGHGIKMLLKSGIHVALITGRHSGVVERRARELRVTDVFQKCLDKRIAYRKLAEKYSLRDHEIAYIGDDIVDVPVFQLCGLPITVADADDEVKEFAKMVTVKPGGRGAVREVCNLLLRAKGLWEELLNDHATA